jgi:lipopolysaccharide export system ATP-binding protein
VTGGAARPALEAEGLSVKLGGLAVLRGVSLSARRGEILGIFGPSGAGKSTLFRALAGEEPLARGRVLLGGEDVTGLPLWKRARRGLGYLPQTSSVLVDLTVAENLAVFERLGHRGPGRSGERRAADLAREVGLGERMGVRAGSLSGGERRRLELVRALSASPSVLLCDEPFAAVDPAGTGRVIEALLGLKATGAAVLLADHHAAEALRVCDRAVLILEGEIAVEAPAAEFVDNGLVRKHYSVRPA